MLSARSLATLAAVVHGSVTAKHVGQQQMAVAAAGVEYDAGYSLLRREEPPTGAGTGDSYAELLNADCTGLMMTSTCDEYKTAAECESRKVNSGSDAFRCSWKPSVPAGDNPGVPANCYVDMAAGSCGITNSTGPS
mmetsp:Transcript_21235/g.39948  ORF Transcript_21235/g.39948 Transcript_21235/m.39948 type:complete len:136 (-) Transcript_21235:198-605(-)